MRPTAATRVRLDRELVLLCRVVKRVIEPRHRPRGVPEGGMSRNVLDAFPVDPHLAPISQTLEKLFARAGATLLTRMPVPASSLPTDLVKAITAALDAE